MAKYKTEEGTIVDTEKALNNWSEEEDHNGSNWISRATKSQWEHETLYKSKKGRYYIEYTSQMSGSLPSAEFISDGEAASWLLLNEHPIPADLTAALEEISE